MFIDGLTVSGLICSGQMPAAEVRNTLAAELDRLVTEVTAAGERRVPGEPERVERLDGPARDASRAWCPV